MSTSEQIATAYGVLRARGERTTVRAVQQQSGVRIGEVAAWLREHATIGSSEVPEPPDLSDVSAALIRSVWAAAWMHASELAEEASAAMLDTARSGETEALEAADRAETERDRAISAQERAEKEAATLRSELSQLQHQFEDAQRHADQAREEATSADRARVRAEATSDTLREIVDSLRGEPAHSDMSTSERRTGRNSD